MGAVPSIVRPGAKVPYVPGAALVVRAAVARAHDGFAEHLPVGEDVDFVWRLAGQGWHVRYEPAAAVAHQHRVRLGSWFARRMDYGTSAAPLEQRHPGTLPAVAMSGWTAAAWAAAADGRPGGGPADRHRDHRRRHRAAGPQAGPAHRRSDLAGGHPAGRGRHRGRGAPAGQHAVPGLVAGGRAGRGGRAPAAVAAGRAGAGPARARLGRTPPAPGPGPLRQRPPAGRRRLQPGRVAGLPAAPHRPARCCPS